MSNRDLEETLKAKPGGENLAHSLNNIKTKAKPLLSKIVETFPDYTSHDITHSERILVYLNLIIPDSLKERLNAYEIYFLVASAYLHDIGRVNFPELFKGEVFEEKEIRDYIGENHHLRSEEFIVKNFKDLAIEDKHQAVIIGRICRGHRKENLHDKELFKPDKMYKNYPINVPLLASFLRIADELDLTFERVPLVIYEHVPPRDTISKEEWEKHLSISGVGLSPEDRSIIKCSATCENPKIHRALKRLETKINRELEDLPNHLYQYREFRRDLPRKFVVEIEAKGYKPYDFKFSLQEKEIVNLLMGEKLYKRKEECLRELLKNSVDACRVRRELLKKRGLSYKPEIVFELTPAEDRIIVTDNGIGMDEDIIERYFTKIGESFYKSPEFLEKELDFTPVSELGIGILSCFMVANKIVVETKTDNSDPLLIEIDDLSDYFFVREGKRKDTGTTVTLFLKDSIKGKIDLKKEIRYYARHLEFPVKVILPSGEEYTIEDVGFKPDVDALLGWYTNKYDFHMIEINDEYVEGVLGILLERDERIGLKPIEKNLWRLPWGLQEKLEKKEKRIFISNEGIFVGNINILPEYFESFTVFIDLNLKRNALDLNVPRNDIVRNDKFDKFINRIETILIKGLENFLRTLEEKAKKANVDPTKLFNKFFANYIDSSEIRNLEEKNKLSDEFLNLLKRFCYFKCIGKDGISYIKYDKIVETGKPICILEGLNHYNEEHIKQIFYGCSGFAEDKLYLLSDYSLDNFAKCLFKDVHSTDFLSFLDIEKSDELKGIIPKTWKLVRFKNYKTSRLIELVDYATTYLNRDNAFIDLLIKGKHILTGDKKLAVEGFFRSLKIDLKADFQKIIAKQKDILKWFVNAGVIGEDDINNYILTKDDFPPHIL